MLLPMTLFSCVDVVGENQIVYLLFWAFCGQLYGDGGEKFKKLL